MIYIHYCEQCLKFHMLNGHKSKCPICNQAIVEAKIAFTDFAKLTENERELYRLSMSEK